jgi:hypothetical protein
MKTNLQIYKDLRTVDQDLYIFKIDKLKKLISSYNKNVNQFAKEIFNNNKI